MAKDKVKPVKWEPTEMAKPPDGIKSSDYTNVKPFIPSYESDPIPNMNLLLSMEYAKIWHKEREEMNKRVYHDTKYLPKKFVVRGLNKKKQDLKADKIIKNKKKVNCENLCGQCKCEVNK